MVVFIGTAAFDESPVDVSRYRNAIRNLPGAEDFDTRLVGDGGCAVVAIPRHRLDAQVCVSAEHGPLVVAGSVRLHNQAELAASLTVPQNREVSNGALVARAFAKWGPNCADRLFGEYGFVVWDRSNRKLFMVSDHIRSVRLFARRDGGRIVFSNHLETLIGTVSQSPRISPEAVADFLARPTLPARHSFFDGVVSAQPGGCTEISAQGERETSWWHPLDSCSSAKIKTKDYEAAFLHHVTTAVANCIKEDAIYGSHLTGGIDSGAVSLIASELLRSNGRSLTAVFSWTPPVSDENPRLGTEDERDFLEAFAREHECKLVLGDTSVNDYRTFLRLPFETLGTADVVDELASIRKARREGVEVVLSGWGGDEAFSAYGFGYLPWLLGQGRLWYVLRAARQITRSKSPFVLLRQVWKDGIIPHAPDSLYRHLAGASCAFEHRCYRSSQLGEHARRDKQLELATRVDAHPYAYSMRLLSTAYPGDRVETWRNWSAEHRLQYRFPLLDRRLLEFMFSVPPDIAFGRGPRNMAGRHFAKRLPNGLGKNDAANEARRARTREQCWDLLRSDVQTGEFSAPCDYLDMARFRRAIMWRPKQQDRSAVLHFAELTGAVRGFYLHERARRCSASA